IGLTSAFFSSGSKMASVLMRFPLLNRAANLSGLLGIRSSFRSQSAIYESNGKDIFIFKGY
ncbi:MAG TPA: hypothetical protein PKM84_02795, partial [Candidatus Pacearchaeota archaeon]|nr:hypothetical protein [Candidatus Pacearchaeota archaeon]